MAINAHDRTRATGGLVTENGSVINSHKDKPSHLNDLASSNRNSMNEEARNQERALTEPRQELQVRPVSLPAAKREISPQDVANGDVFQYQVQDLQSSQSIHQAFQNLRAPRSPDRSPSPGPEAPHDTSKGGKESEQINPGPEIFQTPETERNNPMDTAGTENYDMAASARNAAPTKADRGVDNLTERVEALSEAQGDEDELLAFTNTILEPSRDVVASGVKRLRVPIAEIKARLERQLKECISVIDTLNSLNAQQRNLIVEHTSAINADLAAVEKLPPVRKSTVLGDIEVTMLMWIARRDAQDIKRGREKSARELLEKEQFHAERVHRERLERERAERERLEKRIGEEVERRLAKSGVQNNQSEGTDDPSKVEKYRRPTYPRCNKKYLAKETLEHYGLPYEVDKVSVDPLARAELNDAYWKV